MKYLLTLIIFIIVLGLGGMLFAWSGFYNIAATEPHWDLTVSFIQVLRDRSIDARSEAISVPDQDASILKEAAFPHYHGMCRLCHGAPGGKTNEFARGLNPLPPDFTSGTVQQARSDAELYWIVKNGLKMTGMPAFGPTHGEDELWGLVALAREMPRLSAAEYQEQIEKTGVGAGMDQGHAHDEGEHDDH